MADIVVYGNCIQAVFAAAKAAAQAPAKQVALIVPDVSNKLGGLAAVGGQNFWDTKGWDGKRVYRGSFGAYWSRNSKQTNFTGNGYNTQVLSDKLRTSMSNYSNITVYYSQDIIDFAWSNPPFKLTSVTIRRIQRNANGYVDWGSTATTTTITGSVFIDASDEGRLARAVNSAVTVGRYDWPADKLEAQERAGGRAANLARQPAASLMFKMKGVKSPYDRGKGRVTESDMSWGYYQVPNGSNFAETNQARTCHGGVLAYTKTGTTNNPVKAFNDEFGPQGYILKPLNAAKNGPNQNGQWITNQSWNAAADEWWINALLIFNVDGRVNYRDTSGNTRFKVGTDQQIPGQKSTDEAWVQARDFLSATNGSGTATGDKLLKAIRAFPGFESAEFVKSGGKVVVGEVMYLRETIHMSMNSGTRNNGTENTNYRVTKSESKYAGGLDNKNPKYPAQNAYDYTDNYAGRIGLSFYGADVHPYRVADLKDNNGNYIWGQESYIKMRPDALDAGYDPGRNIDARNPTFMPFNCLTTNYVANLLLAGYAVNVSSYAWGAVRTLPNLSVLGDAAGVAAAYCAKNNKTPYNLAQADVTAIQNTLKGSGVNAVIDKTAAYVV